MIFKQNAFFRSPTVESPTMPAHQLAELILGVLPGWVLLMKRVFGDSVEKIVLLILMMVFVLFCLDKV
jgi:hypothetical protein